MSLILEPDDIDFERYMRETETSHKVKPASSWQDDLNAAFADESEVDPHVRYPWPRLAKQMSIRPEELSLMFGFNGAGKSLLLGQVVLSALAQGARCCIASFEMRPRKTLERMARQFADEYRPRPHAVAEFVGWAEGKLWLYDQTSTVEAERVYAVIRYCVERLGITIFVVDNLTKCVAADDDYAGQKRVVDKLGALAQSLGIHIFLVHHARKAKDESEAPRKMDALGASAITNLVDNVLIVWRNKPNHEKAQPDPREPDAVLMIDKQRHGTGWEGTVNLMFHVRSQQYIEGGCIAMNMRTYPHSRLA